MSCTDDLPAVERETVLPAPPDEVWESLPALVGDEELAPEAGAPLHATGAEGDRVGVVDEADAPRRLAYWWVPVEDDSAPSFVEITLVAVDTGRGAVDGRRRRGVGPSACRAQCQAGFPGLNPGSAGPGRTLRCSTDTRRCHGLQSRRRLRQV